MKGSGFATSLLWLVAFALIGCNAAGRTVPGDSATGGVTPNGGGASGASPTGDASDGGNEPGANTLDALAVPSFQRIAPELPADLQQKVPPGAAQWSSVRVTALGGDGSTVVVNVDFRWEPPLGGAGRTFRWTPQSGAQLLPLPWVDVVSGDGRTVFSAVANYEAPPNIFRWTERGGSIDLVSPELFAEFPYGLDFPPSPGPFASATGDALLARGINDTGSYIVLWQADGGWHTLGVEGGAKISADGSVVLVNETQVWSRARDVETLPDTCASVDLARASGVLLAVCRKAPGEVPYRVFRRLPDGRQVELDAPGTPFLMNADGSVVIFADTEGSTHPVVLWSEATGTLSLSELDGSEGLLGVADSGVGVLFNDFDALDAEGAESVISSIPLRWSPGSGREDLTIPTGYENAYAAVYNSDASIVAGFAFNGSYLGPTVHSESTYRPARSSGAITVWDEQGPRLLTEELADLIDDPSDIENGRPLFVRRTDRAIYVIGTGTAPAQSPPTPDNSVPSATVWVAALPLR